MSRERLLPDVPWISPSALDDWERCPRLYLDRHLLRLPESDRSTATHVGNLVHDLLRHLHGQGDCHDDDLFVATLENHGESTESAVGAMLRRHRDRCPAPARSLGHEVEVVRLSRSGSKWIASGRLDAVWVQDGYLDVRDYKTGRARDGALAEDSRARLQAWLAASLDPTLPVRVRYEHLGDDEDRDPESFAPDAEDLERIEAEIAEVITTIRDFAARRDFPGVADEHLCRTCGYRSICPDSATPGTPTWPLPDG